MRNMRRMGLMGLTVCAGALLSGCASMLPVPKNSLSGTETLYNTNGQKMAELKFKGEFPKDNTIGALAISHEPGGKFNITVTNLNSVNNSNVISAAGTAQADLVNALGTQLGNAATLGARMAGAAAKAP